LKRRTGTTDRRENGHMQTISKLVCVRNKVPMVYCNSCIDASGDQPPD